MTYYERHKEEVKAKARQRYASTPVSDRAARRAAQYEKHGEKRRSEARKQHHENPGKRFRLSKEEYEQLVKNHENKCAICGAPPKGKRLNIDHDHKTGRVRGLLCHDCNVLLGHAKDSTEVLERASEYLKRNQN